MLNQNSSSGKSTRAPALFQTFQLFLLDDTSKNLHIPGHNCQRNVALKTVYPVIQTTVKTMILYRINRRLYR